MIDIHAHYQPMLKEDWWPAKAPDDRTLVWGERVSKINPGLLNLEHQVRDMDERNIEKRAICVSPQGLGYDLPVQEMLRYCRAVDDAMAEDMAKYPGRFLGLACIPMTSPEDAPAELERAVKELGFRGAFIGSNVNGKELDDPDFYPFWETAEGLNVPVLIQSTNPAGGPRLREYYFGNMIGNRFEITLCGCRLIFSGFMDRFPNIKIILGQGGGYMCFAAGRMDHAWRAEEAPKKNVKVPPSTYIPRFYYDSIMQNGNELRYLVDRVGSDRVGIGTDAPYDMGDPDPRKSVRQWITDKAVLNQIENVTPKVLFNLD